MTRLRLDRLRMDPAALPALFFLVLSQGRPTAQLDGTAATPETVMAAATMKA
jgi:hypothetical protein